MIFLEWWCLFTAVAQEIDITLRWHVLNAWTGNSIRHGIKTARVVIHARGNKLLGWSIG